MTWNADEIRVRFNHHDTVFHHRLLIFLTRMATFISIIYFQEMRKVLQKHPGLACRVQQFQLFLNINFFSQLGKSASFLGNNKSTSPYRIEDTYIYSCSGRERQLINKLREWKRPGSHRGRPERTWYKRHRFWVGVARNWKGNMWRRTGGISWRGCITNCSPLSRRPRFSPLPVCLSIQKTSFMDRCCMHAYFHSRSR